MNANNDARNKLNDDSEIQSLIDELWHLLSIDKDLKRAGLNS